MEHFLITGTYNPPHPGHILGALEYIHSKSSEATLYISPSGPWYTEDKSKGLEKLALPADIRIQMLENLIQNIRAQHPEFTSITVEIDSWESQHPGKGWTTYPDYPDVYQHIKKKRNLTELTYLYGADRRMHRSMKPYSASIPRADKGSMSSSAIWKQTLSPDHYAQLVRYHYDQVLEIAIQSFTTQSHKPLKTMSLSFVILCLTLIAAVAGLVMWMIQPNVMMPTLGSGVLDVSNISVVSVLFGSAVILGIMRMIIQFTSRPSPQKTLEPQTTLQMIHDEIQKKKATSADPTQRNSLQLHTPAPTTVRASQNSKEPNSKRNASPPMRQKAP